MYIENFRRFLGLFHFYKSSKSHGKMVIELNCLFYVIVKITWIFQVMIYYIEIDFYILTHSMIISIISSIFSLQSFIAHSLIIAIIPFI